jgi:hypothetical protein
MNLEDKYNASKGRCEKNKKWVNSAIMDCLLHLSLFLFRTLGAIVPVPEPHHCCYRADSSYFSHTGTGFPPASLYPMTATATNEVRIATMFHAVA